MNPTALALVLIGSLLHVGWNAMAKTAEDKLAFLWLAALLPAAPGAVALSWLIAHGELSRVGAACIAASAVIHAGYFWMLTEAYRIADLSFVYPYSRGVGALGACAAGVALLGDAPSAVGWVGIGLAVGATFLEGLGKRRGDGAGPGWRAVATTAATGALIAGYLVIDKIGVARVEPLIYLGGLLGGPVVLLAPLMLRGRAAAELRRSGARPLLASLFLNSAYGVVLWAMALAPVTYVVSARASGIVMSAVVGRWLLREVVAPARWLAVAMITVGVYLISVA